MLGVNDWPMHEDDQVTMFARTNARTDRRVFGIKQQDRRAHMYIIGKTGTGKSSLLKTLVRQDIRNGAGLALLDPHGDLVEGGGGGMRSGEGRGEEEGKNR